MTSTAPPTQPVKRSLLGGFTRLLALCNNIVSMIGLFLVVLAFGLFVAYVVYSLTASRNNPYLDVIGLLILPTVFVAGLAIVPLGLAWTRWRAWRVGKTTAQMRINFADPQTWSAIVLFLSLTFFLVFPSLAVMGYEGYTYTESTAFCTEVCHTVMEPQGVAHSNSPHARVSCAACHIGEGADWFVKSKLSGTRQVFAVWGDTFSRPIPPAITELRPARETCEHCHWPAKFHGKQLKEVVHYSPDKDNTRRVVRMLLKTGGADENLGRVEGIHMHMLVSGQIEYVALDEHLQQIPWVRYVRSDGSESIFRSDGKPHDAPPPDGPRRTVDCMDCHNRGAHHFKDPQTAINLQLEAERIASDLPYIKRVAVQALVQTYPDVPTAEAEIERDIVAYYQEHQADTWEGREADVREAIAAVQSVYKRTFFPEMNTDWTVYPENIGHLNSPGCIRCHDGRHVDAAGVTISSDCEVCHTFLNPIDDHPDRFVEGRFKHSMDLDLHEGLRCSQCHDGGPLLLCRDCHANMRGIAEWSDIPQFRRMPD